MLLSTRYFSLKKEYESFIGKQEMKNKNYKLEICAGCIDSVHSAIEGGADRVELCDNLMEGGTTPSYGLIKKACQLKGIEIFVIIRPRGGDFLYSKDEYEIIKDDISNCKKLGVKGVVIGLLTADGEIDVKRTHELVKLARPMSVTFHRAFDMTQDPFRSLEQLIETGCDRILTSGQYQTAFEGRENLRLLVEQSNDRIVIMPGSGVNQWNIIDIISFTAAHEIHMSGRTTQHGNMNFRKQGVS
ncbi:MAG: copper homeostasis protein CutC, partial [Bacteroidales bacterium]|nr:copper homeostasis protein CutC [Bacteroidales bacterium]